jgi:hypothetical protein
MEALDEYFRLSDAAEAALQSVQESLGDITLDKFVQAGDSPAAAQALQQAVEATPGLLEFLRQKTGDLMAEAMAALFEGRIQLGLFEVEELGRLAERFVEVLGRAGIQPDRQSDAPMGDEVAKQVAHGTYKASAELLAEFDTSDRRAALYATARQRLQALTLQKDRMGLYAATLMTLLNKEEQEPPGESDLLIRAYLGEMRRWLTQQQEEAETEEAEETPPEAIPEAAPEEAAPSGWGGFARFIAAVRRVFRKD